MAGFSRPFDFDGATEEERRAFMEWAWENPQLDEEEQWYEDSSDEFVPCENQAEMRRRLMEAAKNPPEVRRTCAASEKAESVPVDIDGGAVAYFKGLAAETGIAYQKIINLFLVQCAKEKRRPIFA